MHNTLRHIFLQALLFPLVLLVLSCEKEQDKGNDTVILTLQVQLPDVQQTKATVAADDSRNENVLSWIDVFLFSGDGGSGTEVYRTPYKSITPTQVELGCEQSPFELRVTANFDYKITEQRLPLLAMVMPLRMTVIIWHILRPQRLQFREYGSP